jgi:hypothetical protein
VGRQNPRHGGFEFRHHSIANLIRINPFLPQSLRGRRPVFLFRLFFRASES